MVKIAQVLPIQMVISTDEHLTDECLQKVNFSCWTAAGSDCFIDQESVDKPFLKDGFWCWDEPTY